MKLNRLESGEFTLEINDQVATLTKEELAALVLECHKYNEVKNIFIRVMMEELLNSDGSEDMKEQIKKEFESLNEQDVRISTLIKDFKKIQKKYDCQIMVKALKGDMKADMEASYDALDEFICRAEEIFKDKPDGIRLLEHEFVFEYNK